MTKNVLVACLVDQEQPWLHLFLDCLTKLDYSQDNIRYAFLEGKKAPLLHQWAKDRNTWIKQSVCAIADRFEKLAHLRNLLIDWAIVKEDYVFWIDSDVVRFPSSLIVDLMKHNVPVVAPSIYIATDPPKKPLLILEKPSSFTLVPSSYSIQHFYDTFAFRFLDGQKFGVTGLPSSGLLEVRSVGTCYLVDSKLYTEKKVRYYGGDSEQVTFCRAVRNAGGKVYVDFSIKIDHVNLPKYGKAWH